MWGFGWWKKRQERRKAEKLDMEAKSFSALARGLQHAVASVLELQAQQQIRLLDQFHDIISTKDEAGNIRQYFVPRMVTMPVGNGHVARVSLMSLVQPTSIGLDEMEIHMSVRVDESAIKKATSEMDKSEADRVSMKVSMQPRGGSGASRRADTTDIRVKFKANQAPEGMSRIIEHYNNLVLPVERTEYDEKVLKDIGISEGITAYVMADEAKSETFINEAGKLDTLKITKRIKDETDIPEEQDWEDDGEAPVVLEPPTDG